MIEQQINLTRRIPCPQLLLSSDKRKTGTEFQQQTGDTLRQRLFQIILVINLVIYGRETKIIVLLEYLLHQLTLQFRHMLREVIENLALMFE